MKLRLVFVFLLAAGVCQAAVGQTNTGPGKKAVESGAAAQTNTGDPVLDSAINNLYDVISGPAGKKRDWDRFKAMFAPGAQLGVAYTNKNGEPGLKFISPEEYIATSGKYIEEKGFFEKEISRKSDRFGTLVQVWSTYEAREKETDAQPLMRGINSIQLVRIGNQYRIASLIWHQETAQFPLPETYLAPMGK